MEEAMPFANAAGVRIHYQETGHGEPLLLLAGVGGTTTDWGPNLPTLQTRFRAITLDHRGVGRSRAVGTLTIERLAADVEAVMDDAGIERANFVGWSMGGIIAQHLAVQRPARIGRLVLVASMARPPVPSGGGALTLAAAIVGRGLGALPGIVGHAGACLAVDLRDSLHRLEAETLIISGRRDVLAPIHLAEEMVRLMPNAGIRILPDAGHLLPWTHAQEFNAAVIDFLGRPLPVSESSSHRPRSAPAR
jgi:aminoacrylate hydrolase